ncbi:MAG: hypothetical protein B1H09_01475 [Gemmatimonadaceae bacterium 4484_173]|nr:MAG: hypothetical protein B1H09_01475 [Gemmatimonadaceae bacterium 4484_173]
MAFLFGSKSQRAFKKIQDLADSDMVDQAAVMVEEDLDLLLADHEVATKLVPFLMDIGHPDLGGRIGEKIMRTHPDLRMSISRLLEEKQSQFPRSIELLRVIWRTRLHQRDFNGLIELLGRTERLTVSRFAESVQSAYQTLDGVTGRELGSSIDRVLAWSVIQLHRGDPGAAMDVLVDSAERCRFPEESLARLSGWIAARTGGTDMGVNLKRITVLTAIGDSERAISELPSLYDADVDVVNKAVALVEKDLVPTDKTPRARVSLARLIGAGGRPDDASLILDNLIDEHWNSSLLEQAVTHLVISAPGHARVHLLQARLRLARGENTQALDSVDRAFQCDDVVDSPVVETCRKFINSGVDREGLISGKLGEFLVDKGAVEDAVEVLGLRARQTPEWVLEQIQKLLKRDRTSAAVLTLLAVVLLIDKRGGEAAATLKHLSARQDVKSRQDIVSVLEHFDDLMGTHHELRRLRAAAGYKTGKGAESASDWLELLLVGEEVKDDGLLEIYDREILRDRGKEVLSSGFVPRSPAGELLLAAADIYSGNLEDSSAHFTSALADASLVERVTSLISALPFSSISAMKPAKLFETLNESGKGKVVEKLLPVMASSGIEDWMDELASKLVLDSDDETVLFRLGYFIDRGMPGTAASSVQGVGQAGDDIAQLVRGCELLAAGKGEQATDFLTKAATSDRTALLAREVLSGYLESGKASSAMAIALAQAQLKTDDSSGAADTLNAFLDQPAVLEYLESAIVEVPSSSVLQRSLALARLFAGDPEGYRVAAGTAVEGNPDVAAELVQAGIDYSVEHSYAEGLVFAADLGIKLVDGFDSSTVLVQALCMQPELAEKIAGLSAGNEVLGMLLLLASSNPEGFVYRELPKGVILPAEMLEKPLHDWRESENTQALEQLEILAMENGHLKQAHSIRIALAELGVDRSKALLQDTVDNLEYRMDFLRLCSQREQAAESVSQLFPDGAGNSDSGEISAAVDMLVRCKSTDELFVFAVDILENGSEQNREAAGKIVDIFIPTANEDGSLTVPQVVELLLMSGRISEAFSFARGDSELLNKLKDAVAKRDSESDSARALLRNDRAFEVFLAPNISEDSMSLGEALWQLGKRVAACSVWRGAYARTGNPSYLYRLEYAQRYMGALDEASAVSRLLAEKHPESVQPGTADSLPGSSMKMIMYNIK